MRTRNRSIRTSVAALVVTALAVALAPPGPAAAAAPVAVPAADGDRVALRNLIIATHPGDFGLPVWRSILDRAGTPYDVVYARTDRFRMDRLIGADGTGRYNAVLLTNSGLRYEAGNGNYRSAFGELEWNTLWAYERAFDVRQVSLYTPYGTAPEDYCLRESREGEVGSTPVHARLTPAGTGVFDRLATDARIPISRSYLYRTRLAPGCAAEPLLTIGQDVVGVLSTAPDGRQRAALTFTSDPNLVQTDLLGYGLLRWANRGVLVGEQRHWINVDVDDWFNTSTRPGQGGIFRLSGPEVPVIAGQQDALADRHSVVERFGLNLAYNGGDLDPDAPADCSSANTPDPLTSYSRCLRDRFRWINHTVTHPRLNFTSYQRNRMEIGENLAIGREAGFTVPTSVLKTPEYSGLGVYNPDPNGSPYDPPTDFGLEGSNQELLSAAADLGVRYLHGNMSFGSHRPDCFNCGIRHPLRPELLVVPDWPTNISFQAATPGEQVTVFNQLYGPDGRFPSFDHDLSYQEIVDYESDQALRQVLAGSAYSFTLHQANAHVYANGNSLTFDWLDKVVRKYTEYHRSPLLNPDWVELAEYVGARTDHFGNRADAGAAVWDRGTGTISYRPAASGSLFLTGALAPGAAERYGTDTVSRVELTAGRTVTLPVVGNR
ncbi:Agd3-related carbohydrate-binding protein [Amycolatopsis aidingensis]|uniref:Agd3-related carbohydrate-binding protein n=1 Tax=Amycolatopsis aidingensis TaxID=2842453 RepID=UPI001C0DD6D1|nr:hypothetical protein [Amycolatopsis aidingensis]